MGRGEFRAHRVDANARALLALAAGVAAALLMLGAAAATASGATSIESFGVSTSSTQAGGHPDWNSSFTLVSGAGAETAKDATIDLPAGFWLNSPTAVPGCTGAAFASSECESASQIGLVTARGGYQGQPDALLGTAPLYALDPGTDLARIGFTLPAVDVPVEGRLSLRGATDYGPRLRLGSLPQSAPLSALNLTVWGIPAGPSHDGSRFPKGSQGEPAGCPGLENASCNTPTSTSAFINALTVNPSVCDKELVAQLAVSSYEDPSAPMFAEDAVPSTTGCSQQSFFPAFTATPTTSFGYTPAGLDVAAAVPQVGSTPTTPSPSQLRSLSVELPPALVIDPNGPLFTECTDAEAGLGTEALADCGAESRLGDAEIMGIGAPIPAELHLGEPGPEGEDRILILGSAPGVVLKLEASLDIDPETDGLVLAFDLPQLPISYIALHLKGGEDGLLRTPLRCGSYPSTGTFTPWNGSLSAQLGQWPMMITGGPHAAPCVGEASNVQVRLIPQAGPADGAFQSRIGVEVLDPNGTAIPEEDVVITSSDPGQSIGPVVDNEDGTYSSTVTNSTTPGNVTITATDYSVNPPVSGSAILIQNGFSIQPGPATPPVVRISKGAPRKTKSRRPRFSFRADSPGATFACKLDRGPLRPCSSPFTAPKLSYGPHSFAVRATSAAGTGPSATWSFRVVRPKKKRRL